MLRSPAAFFIALLICSASCSGIKTFGQATIEHRLDTTATKQKIQAIRSLPNDVFESGIYSGKDGTIIRYRFFNPGQKEQNPNKAYPLVVVYHGSGSIGTNNESQLGILQKLFASPDIQNKYPAYVLAPQFSTRSSDYAMDSSRKLLYSKPRACVSDVLQLIDSLKDHLNIDDKRIYAVGFSMGGSTVINSLAARPDLFAAGISISGIPQFDNIDRLKDIPIWLIHGLDDTENPISSDEQFYKESGNKIRFWKLRATTHDNIFTSQLLGNMLPDWLFKQHK